MHKYVIEGNIVTQLPEEKKEKNGFSSRESASSPTLMHSVIW